MTKMALNKQKIPLQIQGLNVSTDEKQSVPGTLKLAYNSYVKRNGKFEKRGQFGPHNGSPAGVGYNNLYNLVSYNRFSNALYKKIVRYNSSLVSLSSSYVDKGNLNDYKTNLDYYLNTENGKVSKANNITAKIEQFQIDSETSVQKVSEIG